MSLLDLPFELLQGVSVYLSLGDRQACRLSCRALGPAVEELLFRTISLNICNNKLEPGLSLIQSFRSDFLLSHYVKHLHIGRLEPYSTTHTPEGRYVANTTYPGAGISALLSLQNNLVPFLLSLTNLQSVEVLISQWSMRWVLNAIFSSLANHQHLSLLRLSVEPTDNQDTLVPPLELIGTNLRKLSILCSKTMFQALVPSLRKLILNSPNMTALALSGIFSFQDVRIDRLLEGLTEPRLESLQVEGWHLTSLHNFPVHLRSLSCLRMTDQFSSETHLPQEFWNLLRTERVKLKVLEINHVNEAQVAYLASYSGLEELTYPSLHRTFSVDPESCADSVFGTVLPMHFMTLTSLAIRPRYAGRWCVEEHNLRVLSQCSHLRFLSLCVACQDFLEASEYISRTEIRTVHLILRAIGELKSLKELRIDHVSPGPACCGPVASYDILETAITARGVHVEGPGAPSSTILFIGRDTQIPYRLDHCDDGYRFRRIESGDNRPPRRASPDLEWVSSSPLISATMPTFERYLNRRQRLWRNTKLRVGTGWHKVRNVARSGKQLFHL